MNELKFAMYVRISKKEETEDSVLNINMISQTLAKIKREYITMGEIKNKIFQNKCANVKVNIKMYKKLKIKMYKKCNQLCIGSGTSESIFNLSFKR